MFKNGDVRILALKDSEAEIPWGCPKVKSDGSLETPTHVSGPSLVPSSMPSRPPVPPTFFSDLAFLFFFSQFFLWLFYLSLLTCPLGKQRILFFFSEYSSNPTMLKINA